MSNNVTRPPDTPNPLFLNLGWSIVKYRYLWLLGILAITTLASWLLLTKLTINNNLEVFAPDSPEMDALDEYRAAFGRDDLF